MLSKRLVAVIVAVTALPAAASAQPPEHSAAANGPPGHANAGAGGNPNNSVPPAQAVDTREIVVKAHIAPFIELSLIDSELNWQAPTFAAVDNDLSGNTTPGVGRARFQVESNTTYSLTVTTADGCWQASNLPGDASVRHVRFVHASGDWIGGALLLDRDPASPGVTYDWNTGGDCRITTGTYAAETRVWGLGARFIPRLVGNASNPGGIVGQLPAPGVYAATARITAATQ